LYRAINERRCATVTERDAGANLGKKDLKLELLVLIQYVPYGSVAESDIFNPEPDPGRKKL
jgi:hypothetical protein